MKLTFKQLHGRRSAHLRKGCSELYGEPFELDVESDNTVRELRDLLQAEGPEYSVDGTKLIFDGQVLSDETLVKDIGVQAGKYLVVFCISPRPQAEAAPRPAAAAPHSNAPDLDFDKEGRHLLARLNLESSSTGGGGRYNALDAIWRHPETSASLYVGNRTAATSVELRTRFRITHIVNCTTDMPNFHDDDAQVTYLRFDISAHYGEVRNDRSAVAFVRPMLEFVRMALGRGENVLVHCLAGAHRAGTTAIICLMHFAGLSKAEAIAAAQQLRPIIEPIGGFPVLLERVERGWREPPLLGGPADVNKCCLLT